MGLRSFFSGNSSSTSSETRRPVLDPDSDAVVWATDVERADDATVDRMLAQARADLDAMDARLAEHRRALG